MKVASVMHLLRRFELMVVSVMLSTCVNQPGVVAAADERDERYEWRKASDGWEVGGRLLSSSSRLQSGDPAVFAFALRNSSDEQQTVVIRRFENSYPTLGGGNRINLNITGSSQQRHQHTLEPGETLQDRQYRITLSTEGLPPGEYTVTASPVFWRTSAEQPNRGTGIGSCRIRFVVGDPEQSRISKLPQPDKPAERIYWGEHVAGLVVGMRLPDGRQDWGNEDLVEGEMFVRNVSDRVIDFEYEILGATDWNMHMTAADGKFVRLNSLWLSGIRRRITRQVVLRPFEQQQLFLPEGDQPCRGPQVQLLKTTDNARRGGPKQLITDGGDFQWHAHITIKQKEMPDITIVAGSSGVPLSVKAD